MLKDLNKVKDEPSTSKLNVINKDIVGEPLPYKTQKATAFT
jgi:hypothetical protein